MRNLKGPEYMASHLLEPNAPDRSNKRAVDGHTATILRKVVNTLFPDASWTTVKDIVNRGGRDAAKKIKRAAHLE